MYLDTSVSAVICVITTTQSSELSVLELTAGFYFNEENGHVLNSVLNVAVDLENDKAPWLQPTVRRSI